MATYMTWQHKSLGSIDRWHWQQQLPYDHDHVCCRDMLCHCICPSPMVNTQTQAVWEDTTDISHKTCPSQLVLR